MSFRAPTFRTREISNFYPRVDELRAAYDVFFSNPGSHGAQHQCIDFWWVPESYCYMRTDPVRIIGIELHQHLWDYMNAWARSEGLSHSTGGFLSFYVNGCFQCTHSDQTNGSIGWVLSLTHWDTRRFTGGETCVAREGAFEELEPRRGRAGSDYWEIIPPRYGQLTLFDDRVAHMVPVVMGTMDPLQARVVIHGHFV